MIGVYGGYSTKFLLYSVGNIAIRASSIAIGYLLPQESQEAERAMLYKISAAKKWHLISFTTQVCME